MSLKNALEELRRAVDERYEVRKPVTYGLVTSVQRDNNNQITSLSATIDNVTNVPVVVPYGIPIQEGAQIEVRASSGKAVGPQYELIRVVQSNTLIQVDLPFGALPTPDWVYGSWATGIQNAESGGPFSGMKSFVTVVFKAPDYSFYKISYYVLQCKRSQAVEWEVGLNIPATLYPKDTHVSYTFNNLEVSTSYDFRIAAVSVGLDQSAWSVKTITSAGDNVAPAPPSGFAVVSIPGAIDLDWADNVENDIAGYRVYYSTTNGPWVRESDPGSPTLYYQVNTSNKTFGTDFSASVSWFFNFTAVDTSGNESLFSGAIGPYQPGAASTVGAAPTTPTGVTATWTPYIVNGTQLGRVSVQWTKSTFADTAAAEAYSIRYRQSPDGASWSAYRANDATNPTQVSSTVREFVVLNLKPGQYYEFQVSAYDASARFSAWSTAASLTPAQTTADTTPPANVTGLASADGATTFYGPDLNLVWNANTEEDLAGYKIEFHSSSAYNAGSRLRTEYLTSPATTASGKVAYRYDFAKNVADRGGTVSSTNATVYVAVWAIDTAGNLSSIASTGTFTNPAPPAATTNTPSNLFRFVFFDWTRIADPDNRDFAYFQVVIEESVDSGFTSPSTVLTTKSLDTNISYKGTGGYYYRVKITAYDLFTQSSSTTTSASVLNTYTPIITPEDLAGRAYQITPTAQAGIKNTGNTADATDTDLKKLYDYDLSNGAIFNPDATERYVRFEYPVQFVFNKTSLTVLTSTANVYLAYSPDGTTWTYLCGTAGHGLNSGAWVETSSQATAQTNYYAAAVGTSHAKWPTMRQAKYLRLYLKSSTRIAEWKNDVYLVADTIDAGTLNLAVGINIYDDPTNQYVGITSAGVNLMNGRFTISTAVSGSTSSRIVFTGSSLTGYNGNSPSFQILASDGSFWGNRGGFGGSNLAGAKITLDGATGNVSITGALSIGTSGYIQSGTAAFSGSTPTGTGYYVDYNGGSPRFLVGNVSGNNYLSWDASSLTARGTINADAGYLGSLNITGTLTVQSGGKLLAGGGNITLDTTGITVASNGITSSYVFFDHGSGKQSKLRGWVSAGGVLMLRLAGYNDQAYLEVQVDTINANNDGIWGQGDFISLTSNGPIYMGGGVTADGPISTLGTNTISTGAAETSLCQFTGLCGYYGAAANTTYLIVTVTYATRQKTAVTPAITNAKVYLGDTDDTANWTRTIDNVTNRGFRAVFSRSGNQTSANPGYQVVFNYNPA